ncbi:inorganic diphosphatase [Blastomonas sp.]|uniref:inorganic diphosphatase n=1 Tax=Blastomonas sp. TaxID=1909299 RepID=UPI0035930C98
MHRALIAALTCLTLWAAPLLAGGTGPATHHPQPTDGDTFFALIEISAGSAVKYEIDPASGRLIVDRFLSMPVVYPANYGFVPGSLAGDGDPLDVLVYTRTPIVPGALIEVRAIGMLRMTDGGKQDDKLIAVPTDKVDPGYAAIRDVADLPAIDVERLTMFFRVYKHLPQPGGDVVLGDIVAADIAHKETRDAIRRGAFVKP